MSCKKKIEYAKILDEQVKFRLSQFWRLSIKVNFASSIIALLPLFDNFFGFRANQLNIPLWIFPIIGFTVSLVINVFSFIETKIISKIEETLYNELRTEYPTIVRAKHQCWVFPIIFLILQFVLSALVLFITIQNIPCIPCP